MLRYKTETRPGLVALHDIWKMEWVNSYNPGAASTMDITGTVLVNKLLSAA